MEEVEEEVGGGVVKEVEEVGVGGELMSIVERGEWEEDMVAEE